MAEEWLVDGYNLLHTHLSSKPSGKRSSREDLLAQLADFASFQGRVMLVVLDGQGDEAELDIHRTRLFGVVYSQKVSADACIERLLYARRGQAVFTVVTNDRAISNIARGAGALVMGAQAFLALMKDSKKDRSDNLHKRSVRSHGFNRPFEDKLKDE